MRAYNYAHVMPMRAFIMHMYLYITKTIVFNVIPQLTSLLTISAGYSLIPRHLHARKKAPGYETRVLECLVISLGLIP